MIRFQGGLRAIRLIRNEVDCDGENFVPRRILEPPDLPSYSWLRA